MWINSISDHARSVDQIAMMMLIVSAFFAGAVWVLLLYFSYKYRKGSDAGRQAPPVANVKAEFGISFLILAFGLCSFAWGARIFYHSYLPPKRSLPIYVVAKQWMWTFHDPEKGDQLNRLVVPENRPVRLIMTSEDVIHSFYVPALRLKQDVLPGRYTSVWFNPRQKGTYRILCAEFCGLDHSRMRGELVVVSQEEYAGLNSPRRLASGAATFHKYGCAGCHSATHDSAPALQGLFNSQVVLADGRKVTADENYLRRSILQPNSDIVAGYVGVMPTFQGQVSEQELIELVEYIKNGARE